MRNLPSGISIQIFRLRVNVYESNSHLTGLFFIVNTFHLEILKSLKSLR